MVTDDLHIDPEFHDAAGVIDPERLAQLEANILADGRVIDPILYWWDEALEKNLVVDGMHRLPIAKRHGIPYHTEPIAFASRTHALLWICEHADGRRHHTAQQRKVLLGKIAQYRTQTCGGDRRSSVAPSAVGRTRDRVAASQNASPRTVARAAAFVANLEKLPKALAASIEKDEVKATDAEVKALAAASADKQQSVARDLRVGNAKTLGEAMQRNKVSVQPAKATSTSKPKTSPKKPATTKEQILAEVDAAEDEAAAQTAEERMHEHNQLIESYCKSVTALMKKAPDLHWTQEKGRLQGFVTKVKQACTTLRSAKSVICPHCNGEGCDACQDQGFLPKMYVD